MELFAHPFSSYCQKVLIALYENDTPFDFRMLAPDDRAGRGRARGAAGRSSAFPLLVDDGRTVLEASIIIEHLRAAPSRAGAADPRGRARRARRADDGPLLRQLRHDADAEDRGRQHPRGGGSRPPRRRRGADHARHRLSLARRQDDRARMGGGRRVQPRRLRRRARRCSTPTGPTRSPRNLATFMPIAGGCSRARPSRGRSTRRGPIVSSSARRTRSRLTAKEVSMSYVDGFIVPVPKSNLEAYKALARTAGEVWKEYGALAFVECVADDVPVGELTSFRAPCRRRKTRSSSFHGSSIRPASSATRSMPRSWPMTG